MNVTYMAYKARISVDLLPPLGVVDGVVMVRRVEQSPTKALVHTSNLLNIQ